MRLTPRDKKDIFHLAIISLMVLIMLVAGLVAVGLGQTTAAQVRTQLSERSRSIADALGPEKVMLLQGAPSDADTLAYQNLKVQLAEIKTANPDARSIYLMGRHGGRLFFFVDSEPTSSSQYSPAGDWYDDGTQADHDIFDNGGAFVEGLTKDSYGTFISGLAPIYKPGTHAVLAVLGIDIDASTYQRDIVYAISGPLVVGLALVLILAIFELSRRRDAHMLALRSELVSVASHELSNPITGIRWAASILQKLVSDQQAAEKMVINISNSAALLQESTNDILELSHAMNHRSLNITSVNMAELMQEIVQVQTLGAQEKDVTINFDKSWPAELMIDCDEAQMKRVLHNVLSNAIKYTERRTAVTIAYKDVGKFHQLLVSDQGIGIPADEQGKVFRGFYRASNAVAKNIPGTGLGLYLVKTVLERHGGSVTFTSEEGKGTTFVLNIPKRR
ncbi:MAG TPA: HAMP domain-containing sensor histidine kinase [Candidatus Acidoferrum sp.]|nr:HAMP domain-containing sensor histidine kinase [Candidatus Acidoferrum sp.]